MDELRPCINRSCHGFGSCGSQPYKTYNSLHRKNNVMDILNETLSELSRAFRQIEAVVPAPRLVTVPGGEAFRYVEKSLEQALVQKLARLVSGLGAAKILLQHGYTQEIAVLQRTLDELGEDITFLCQPLHGEPLSPNHERYLEYFYEEEFDETGDPLSSAQSRGTVTRRRIRAAIANSSIAPGNPSDNIQLFRTLSRAYSGYVHAASPQIMDMVGGCPALFHVEGMLNTPRMPAVQRDLLNYFYRSIGNFALVALCLDLKELTTALAEHMDQFGLRAGLAQPHRN